MSSLAAARADNFYFPPDWQPSRGGLNKFNNSHGALGKRAAKLHLGILVIRFEMMYNSWCLGCGRAIGRGTRYNAEKKKVGMYFTTPIYEFSMKCATCPQKFIIRTDPEHRDYNFVSGIRKKVEGYNEETAKEAGAVVLASKEEKARLEEDAFFALEHKEADKRRARSAAERLAATAAIQERTRHDFQSNKLLRAAARAKRKQAAAAARSAQRRGLGMPLLPRSRADATEAKEAFEAARVADWAKGGSSRVTAPSARRLSSASSTARMERRRIRSADIFAGSKAYRSSSGGGRGGSIKSTRGATSSALIVKSRKRPRAVDASSVGAGERPRATSKAAAARARRQAAAAAERRRGIDIKRLTVGQRRPSGAGQGRPASGSASRSGRGSGSGDAGRDSPADAARRTRAKLPGRPVKRRRQAPAAPGSSER